MWVSAWTRQVTALLVMSMVLFAGELALAQDAPPPGPPGPQGPPSAPGTPGAPGQTGGSEQPGTPPVSQQTIQGDTAAWAEMEAAYKKLDSLSGYRDKESGVGHFGESIVIIMEVIPPNSIHITREATAWTLGPIATPAISVELVEVNHQTRIRVKKDGEPWGPWECSTAPSADTRSTSNRPTVEASRGPDTAIEGTPVRTYAYTITSLDKTVTIKTTVYVDPQTGLPRRKVQVIKSNELELPKTMTTDYYDYDSKIEITLPPCG